MPPQSITPGINPDVWSGPQTSINPAGFENSPDDRPGRLPHIPMWDADGDGIEDREDYDDDNDGIDDDQDFDDDGDGTPDWVDADWLTQNGYDWEDLDSDSDYDGIPDYFDLDYEIDHDGDGVPNNIDKEWLESEEEMRRIFNDIIQQNRENRPEPPIQTG